MGVWGRLHNIIDTLGLPNIDDAIGDGIKSYFISAVGTISYNGE